MRIILDKIRKTIENNNESGKNIIDTKEITLELDKLSNKVNGIGKEVNKHSKEFEELRSELPKVLEDLENELEKNTKKILEHEAVLEKILKYIEQENKTKEQQELKIKELENRIKDLEHINKNWITFGNWKTTIESNEKRNSEKIKSMESKFNGIEKYINTERYKKTIKRETDNEQVLSVLKNGRSQPKEIIKNFKGGTKSLYDTLKRLEKSGVIIKKKDGKQVFYELKH